MIAEQDPLDAAIEAAFAQPAGSTSVAQAPIDKSRPRIENSDGSFSTERSITVGFDEGYYNIPTIIDGVQRTPEEAIQAFKSGRRDAVSGPYPDETQAISAAEARSAQIGVERGGERAASGPDEYDRAIAAAFALDDPTAGDYAALPVRGAMESVAGPLRGLGGMADAMRRQFPWMSAMDVGEGPSAFTAGAEAIRGAEPDINPEAEHTLGGRLLEGAGQVAGLIGQTMLMPGGAAVRAATGPAELAAAQAARSAVQQGFAAGSMGSQAFGGAQERALAEGATPEQADLEGALNFPLGAAQALVPARAAAVLSRSSGYALKTAAGAALREGATNAALGSLANVGAEGIAQAIHGKEDADALWKAAKQSLLPDAIIGAALGGVMRWHAAKNGPLTPEAGADLDAAGEALAKRGANDAANAPRSDEGAESPTQAPGEPIRGADGEPAANPEAPRSTLIEEPDPELAAAATRFRESIRRKKPVELHEAPDDAREEAGWIGMRTVEVDAGEPLPVAGYYDRPSRTSFVDRHATPEERRAEVRRHEAVHFMEDAHPELAKEWGAALEEVAPGWLKKQAAARAKTQAKLKLPGLTPEGAAQEGRAEAAENLSTVLRLVEHDPVLVQKIADYKPSVFRALADATIDFAHKIGLAKKPSVRVAIEALNAQLAKTGSSLEKSAGAQGASRLALKLRDLHRAMRVEEPVAQPRANEKPSPFLEPKPLKEGEAPEPQGPQKRDAEALATRKALTAKEGMPPEDAATALDVIDRRLEDALTGGESPDSPRIGELKKDRAAAVRLIYEGDPAHPALSKESPVDLWNRIVAEDERATKERRDEQARAGVERTKAVREAEKKLDAEIEHRRREVMKRVSDERRAEQKRARDEAAAEKRARKDELKALKDDIRSRVKPEEKPKPEKPAKPPTKKELAAREAEERAAAKADLERRIAEKKATEGPKPEEPKRPEVEAVPEPPKPKIPVARRERLKREELSDPHIRSELERMAATAGWETEGGKALLRGDARNAEGHRGRTKWIPKDAWFKEIPAELKMNEADARNAIESALKDYPLGVKQKAFVEWAIDRADGEVYRGVQGEERAAARKAYDEMAERQKLKSTERDIGPDEVLPEAETDTPFALRREDRIDEFADEHADDLASKEDIARVLRAGGRVSEVFPRPEADIRRELGFLIRMGSKAGPGRNPFLDTEKGVRLRGLVRLFTERERALTDQTTTPTDPFTFTESSRRTAYEAERAAQKGWLDTFQKALREGSSDAEAARAANDAHPEALQPAAFLSGMGDEQFALHGASRDGSGLEEFLRRYKSRETHYAVTSGGELTQRARAASEEFWQKETRSRTQTLRAAREMASSAAGKAEIDAAIRGERAGDWREQSALTVAAELRVSSLLRAAAQGTTSAKKALGLAVDYYMLRSEQGRALSSVQYPRDAREAFYREAAEPSAENAKALKKLQNQLKVTSTKEAKAAIRERIEEIKAKEAKRIEDGFLALRKAGIDPEAIKDPASAAHALKVFGYPAKKIVDMVLEFRASSMVSSPASSIAALGGNVLNVGWNTGLSRLAELPVPKGATTGEVGAILAALPGAWNKGLRAFWNVLRHDAPTYEAQLQNLGLIESAQHFENAKLSAIPGKAGRVVRGIGLTPMTAVDEFARALGSELEAVGIAYRRSGGDAAKMQALLGTTEVWEEAVKRTRRSIFQERESNPFVELGFKARETLDKVGGDVLPVGNLIFPFVQTGVNGVLEGLRKLPGPAQAVALKHLIKGEWKGNHELRAQDAAANILSGVIATTAWSLATMTDEDGVPYITGTASTDRSQRSLEYRTAPPMSFRFGNSDQWYSYAKWMPFASVTATLVDAAQDGVEPWGLTKSVGRQAIDQTYFRTLAAITEWIQSDAPSEVSRAKAIRDFSASFVPNIVSGALRARTDGVRNDPLRAQEDKQLGITEGIMSRIGSGEGEIRTDNWGRPADKGGSWFTRYLSPSPPTGNIADIHAADLVIRAWNASLPKDSDARWAPADAPYWYRSKGVTHYMTNRQFAAFQKRAGEIAASQLDESTLDPKNPTQAQIDRIKRTLSRARKIAKREVLRDIPYDEDNGE